MPTATKRNGGDRRGSSADRRARRAYLLRTYGDGTTCRCVHCACDLTDATVEADRIDPSQGYARANVLPACRVCNAARGNAPLRHEARTAALAMRYVAMLERRAAQAGQR
jgi:5-methylcytosine-specific restriction endonuclease McrA